MNGIGYDSKIIIFNSTGGAVGDPVIWYGTELEHVRVELQRSNLQTTSGETSVTTCTVKIHDEDLAKPYETPESWKADEERESSVTFDDNSFFIITDKADIGICLENIPTGQIRDDGYDDGLMDYLTRLYGGVYKVKSAQHYSLIPHWEIGGA